MAEKLDLDALERLIEAALADGCQDVRVPTMPLSEFTKAQREIQRRMRQNNTAYMSGWNDGQRALSVQVAAEPRSVAPEGWKLVPIEPTAGMLDAATPSERVRLGKFAAPFRKGLIINYRAMIAAAPSPENMEQK